MECARGPGQHRRGPAGLRPAAWAAARGAGHEPVARGDRRPRAAAASRRDGRCRAATSAPRGRPRTSSPRRLPLPPEIAEEPDRPAGRPPRRARELQSAGRRDRPAPSRERVLLVSGDAGIGKTRLLAETARRAHAAGAIGARRAGPRGDARSLPAVPRGASGTTRSTPRSRICGRSAGDSGAELARLIPELRRRLPELRRPEPGDPETDRYRLFEAVAGLLGEISAASPLLVVLDDLHWADRPTLLLLRHLARAPQACAAADPRRLPLGRARGRGVRGGARRPAPRAAGARAGVAGLPEPDAAELVRLRTRRARRRRRSCARSTPETEGNPFFIEEIVRHLADSGVRSHEAGAGELQRFGLPEGVAEVISRRLERLDEDGLEWLRGGGGDRPRLRRRVARDGARLRRGARSCGRWRRRWTPGWSNRVARRARALQLLPRAGARDALRGDVVAAPHADAPPGRARARAAGATATGAARWRTTSRAPPSPGTPSGRSATRCEAGEQATAMLAHEEAAEHYARALEVLERSIPRRSSAAASCCSSSARRGCAAASGRRPGRCSARRRRWPGDWATAPAWPGRRSGRRGAIVQPPGRGRRGADRAARAGARDDSRSEQPVTRVRLLTRLCGALYYSLRASRRDARLSAEATAIAAELGDPEAARWPPRRGGAPTGARPPGAAAGGLDAGAALRPRGRRRRADPAGPRLADGGSARGRRPRRRSRPRWRPSTAGAERAAPAAVPWNGAVWRAMLALLDGRLADAERWPPRRWRRGSCPRG